MPATNIVGPRNTFLGPFSQDACLEQHGDEQERGYCAPSRNCAPNGIRFLLKLLSATLLVICFQDTFLVNHFESKMKKIQPVFFPLFYSVYLQDCTCPFKWQGSAECKQPPSTACLHSSITHALTVLISIPQSQISLNDR